MNALILIISLVSLLIIVAWFIFWRTRKLLREAKNYERGLKMVPFLIHLPPVSDDNETQGRDDRDVIDKKKVLWPKAHCF
jgi:hypothetical protein